MGEKDLTEKVLMSFSEVFADIYNVLLFQNDVVDEKELYAYETESFYKEPEGKVKNQFRDITKRYVVGEKTRGIFCIENESQIDTDMPVRVMGYDYGNYRKMIQQKETKVPVVTIVLNFGKKRWNQPICLKECLSTDDKLEPYVRDYGMYVFDVAFLPKRIREKFKSDFGIVADYFAEKGNVDFVPDMREIRHPEEVLDFLATYADERYETIKEEVRKIIKQGRRVKMDEFVERLFQKGRTEGLSEGISQGISQGISKGEERIKINQICKKLQKGKSLEQIADEIEESVPFVERVSEIAKDFAPEYDGEKVCQAWWDKNEKIAG